MKLKEKFQRFWTLSKNRKGFTLVELIVVIAILAILAGVAIPVYNGYIKKAQNAADQQLLDSVSTAFAAACLTNGADHVAAAGTTLTVNANGTIATVANGAADYGFAIKYAGAAVAADVAAEIEADFAMFFAGNESAAFKGEEFANGLVVDAYGNFVAIGDGASAGYITLTYGGGTITISKADAEKLANSTFNNKLGVEGLLNKVNQTAEFASSVNSTTFNNIVGSEDFQKTFLENLGVDTSNMQNYEIGGAFNTQMNTILTNMGIDLDTATNEEIAAAQKKVTSNMAVLYAAQSTDSMTDEQIKNLLYTDTPKQTILAGTTNGDQLAQAALYYGMYVAYANNSGNTELIDSTDNPIGLLSSLNDENTADFKAYLDTDQGKADLEAYMASMNIIRDSSTGNADVVSNLMANGFSDPDLADLLQSAIGK